jgi:NlpC/P60 family putative phage cell wall peptidase
MTTRADIVAEARTWLGTPFHHQARLKSVGVDCAGLIIGVARALDLVSPDFDVTAYQRSPDGLALLEHCNQHMIRTTREAMKPGDVIVIRWRQHPQHLGILGDYLHGGLSLIHAFSDVNGRGKVIEQRLDLSDMVAGGRFVAAFRLPGVV